METLILTLAKCHLLVNQQKRFQCTGVRTLFNCTGLPSKILSEPVQLGCGPLYDQLHKYVP